MQFVVTAYDGKDMLEKRMAVRPRHLEGMAALGKHIVCAGGMLDEAGKPKGSVLVLDFDSREQVDAYLANEPYVAEKVWADVKVEPLNVVILQGEKVGK